MFAKNLAAISVQRGLGPGELAMRAGVSTTAVHAILAGKRQKTSNRVMKGLADALGVTVQQLAGESYEPPAPTTMLERERQFLKDAASGNADATR